jgi:thiol-disulfide isomerase/thioredoxin
MMNKKIVILLSLSIIACGTERNKNRQQASNNSFRPSESDIDNQEDADQPQEVNCPNRDNPVGFSVGDTFPSTRYPNADWEGVSIKSLCGSKAILVVSATEWCGACIVEFDYLAMIAEDWKDRGGEVYYTLFENSSRQPAGRATLAAFEDYMLQTYGSIPFRVLSDSAATLPRSINNGGVTLPLAWLLDEEMVIVNFSGGTNGAMVTGWMENLLR